MGFLKRLFGGMSNMPEDEQDVAVDETTDTEEVVEEPAIDKPDTEEQTIL